MRTIELGRPGSSPCSRVRPLEPELPRWALELFDPARFSVGAEPRNGLDVLRRDPFLRVTARIPGAARLPPADLSIQVAEQYVAIGGLLAELDRHPIRFWNYVPGIVETLGPGTDRYMAFNAGRYQAYTRLHGPPSGFGRSIPTASAVGIDGVDMVIDCLASDRPGAPVENPRQTASWRYSRRYGPRPPCFARGTVTTIEGRRFLLLGGTASIVGQASRHPGSLASQLEEVLTNMEALVGSALGHTRALAPPGARSPLARLIHARIYVVHADDAEPVERAIEARAGRPAALESVVARICRPELLVEVEGIALLD